MRSRPAVRRSLRVTRHGACFAARSGGDHDPGRRSQGREARKRRAELRLFGAAWNDAQKLTMGLRATPAERLAWLEDDDRDGVPIRRLATQTLSHGVHRASGAGEGSLLCGPKGCRGSRALLRLGSAQLISRILPLRGSMVRPRTWKPPPWLRQTPGSSGSCAITSRQC